MNISKVRSLGVLSLINFGRKHADKCAADKDDAIQARALIVRAAAVDAENACMAYRPCARCG